jgi:hypothetical protein
VADLLRFGQPQLSRIAPAQAGEYVAAKFIAVEPIDESAREFYRQFDFQNIDGDSKSRMYLRIDVAIKTLGIELD